MFGQVLGALSGEKKVEATITINTGGLMSAAQSATTHAHTASSSHTTTTTSSTSFENRITGQMEFFKSEADKFKKENENLKLQIQKHSTIINTQAKTISELKQEKTLMLQKQISATSTTTSSADDKAKIAELTRRIDEVCSDDVADKTKINNQEIEIGQLKVKIDQLEIRLRDTIMTYEAKITTLSDENRRLNSRISSSLSNDVDDATKIKNLHLELDKLRDELAARDVMLHQYEENVNHWKFECETRSSQMISIEKEKDSVNLSLDMAKHNVEEKDAELESLNAKFKEMEDKIVQYEVTIAQREKKIAEAEAKVNSLNEKVKTANTNSEKFLEKSRKSETELANILVKFNSTEKSAGENKKLYEMMKTKSDSLEVKASVLEKRNIELNDMIEKMKVSISDLKAKDIDEDKELENYRKLAAQKSLELEKLQTEDVTDKSVQKSQKDQIINLHLQIDKLTENMEKLKVTISERDKEITSLKAKILKLKELLGALKFEVENAHGLSMKFEIKKETTSSVHEAERTKERVETSAEYKSLKLEVEQHMQAIETEKAAKFFAIQSCESLNKELANVKADLENSKRQLELLSVQLEQEKSVSAKYFEEKKSFTMSSSKEVEKEKQCFQSAIETVSTYKDDITKVYGSINVQFSVIDKELM